MESAFGKSFREFGSPFAIMIVLIHLPPLWKNGNFTISTFTHKNPVIGRYQSVTKEEREEEIDANHQNYHFRRVGQRPTNKVNYLISKIPEARSYLEARCTPYC